MTTVKDWVYAYKVCKKYGIKWNPFYGMKNAMFTFTYWFNYRKHISTIKINPLYPSFMDSFMHEVGHCVHHRKAYRRARNYKEYEEIVSKDKLREEYLAWRFSKLALKQRFDKNRARSMFKTYFPSEAKKYGSLVAADKYSNLDYRLSK